MQRLKLELSNRRGFTLILSVLLIVVFIGAAAFAVDASHAQLRRADVHAASDAAALAGIQKYAESGDEGQALTEAQLFAGKFKADTTALTVLAADFSIGHWDSVAATFTAGGTPKNAAQAIVRYTGNYTFGPVLGINSHASSATSVAVGVASKTVSKSSCAAPVVMSFGDMLSQIGLGQSTSDSLNVADIDSLINANAGKAVTFDIPNGTKVNGIQSQEFYQINIPPKETAAGVHQADGPPSAADFKNGFTCGGSVGVNSYAIGVGDWVEPIQGQKANQAKQGMQGINGGSFPVTFEVALAATFGNSPDGFCVGCFQIKYLASFTATAVGAKTVTGYFNTLSPPSGGIVTSGTGSGPLELIQKTRLVY